MLDFRYHALSLVAVFLALGIGIVLGSSLGDTVGSQANRDLAKSLRGDLNRARAGATPALVGQLASPPDLATLGEAVGPRFAGLRSDDKRLRPLGRKLARALVSGGRLARRLEKRFP